MYRLYSRGRLSVVALIAVLVSGCTVQEQSLPMLAGPSELGLGMSLTAAPEILPRDGSSMSRITAKTFDSGGKPKGGVVLKLQTTSGTLSVSEVTTGTDGTATFTFIAPDKNTPVDWATIYATPVQNQTAINNNPRLVELRLMGPSVPVADFKYTPPKDPEADPAPMAGDPVSFTSTSTVDKVGCGSSCSYSWNFDDGSSGQGLGVQHVFGHAGVFNVTLTVTYLAAGTTSSVTKPVIIAPPPAAPTAGFTVQPASPTRGVDAAFDASVLSTVGAPATIVLYQWDFGDGSSTTGASPTHNYAGTLPAGPITVTLTVTDSLSRQASTTRVITLQ